MSESKKIRVLGPLPHPDEDDTSRLSIGIIPAEEICEMCQNLAGSLAELGRVCREKGIKFRRFPMFESQTLGDAQRCAEEDAKLFEALDSITDGVEVSEEDDT